MITRAAAGVLLCLTASAACSSGSSPASSPAPTPPAADRLAHLASASTSLSFSGSYTFHQVTPDQTATVQVWRTPAAVRVDIATTAATATLIVTGQASYSCATTKSGKACYTVAGAGQPLPKPFDVAPATLFSSDLQLLATDTAAYAVTDAPAPSTAPTGVCFAVQPRPGATATGAPTAAHQVPPGTYCFAADGLLTAATYPSGNTVRLTQSSTATPPAAQFTPYVSPTPLPS